MGKKVWIINQNSYLPEDGPHTRHYAIGKYLVRDGYEVCVFAGNELHHAGKRIDTGNSSYLEKIRDGVRFFYVKTHHYTQNDIHRVINIFSFYVRIFSVAKKVEKKYGRPDIIYSSTNYPTALLAGVKLAGKYDIRCISETRDIVPEGFIAKGTIRKNGIIAKSARCFMKYVYEHSNALVFTMSGGKRYISDMKWNIEAGGKIDLNTVYYINNGVDREDFEKNAVQYFIKDPDLDDPRIFKVVYFGAIRFLNNMPLYMDVARILKKKGKNNIKLLMWGTGSKVDQMKKKLKEEHLDNLVLKGYVDKSRIPGIAKRADLFIGSGNSSSTDRYGASFNKLFDYFAGGKPMLILAGLSDSMVESAGCGREMGSHASPEEIADEIIRFSEIDKQEYKKYCENSLAMAEIYDYRRLSKRVEEVIEKLI